jgi:tRNA uridine 5-carboxymethylaminomethyl modification enzyme
MTVDRLAGLWPELRGIPDGIGRQLENEARYQGYLERQRSDAEALKRDMAVRLPEDIPVDDIAGLSAEIRSKLRRVRPGDLAAAARIPGITPAALGLVLAYVRRRDRERAGGREDRPEA